MTTAIATLPPPVVRLTWTLDEFAEQLGVSRKTVAREADAGNLRTVKIRGRRMVRDEDAKNYLASLSSN